MPNNPEQAQETKDEQIKKRLLEKLGEENVIMDRDGQTVVDIQKLIAPEFIQKFRYEYLGTKKNGKIQQASLDFIYNTLGDMPVVSFENMGNSSPDHPAKAKPLFNLPENADEAFDPKKAKEKEYYLNYWDLSGKIKWNKKIKAKDGSEINPAELALFTKLFRDYGALRNEQGELVINDKGENRPVSVEWIWKNIGGFGNKLPLSVHKFLREECPHLLKKGLLKYSDFKTMPGGAGGEMIRKEKEMKQKPRYYSYDGIRYYIGRDNFQFEGEKIPMGQIVISELEKGKLAGISKIVDGQKKLLYVLDLLSSEEKAEKYQTVRSKYEQKHSRKLDEEKTAQHATVKKDDMQQRLRSWLRTSDNPPKKDETHEQYAERIALLQDFDFIKDTSDKFLKETGIGLHNLSWREQQWLCAAAHELKFDGDYARLIEFSKKFGLDGLKTFLHCEFDISKSKLILDLGEKLPEEKAKTVFAKSGELIDLAEKNSSQLLEHFQQTKAEIDQRDIKHELLRKSLNILERFSQANKQQIDELLTQLQSSRKEITILSALIHQLKNRNEDFGIENIKNLKLETREIGDQSEFSQELKKTVLDMAGQSYSKIYADNPKAFQKVMKKFETRLENIQDFRVYMLTFKGELVAFCTMQPTEANPKIVMAESLIADPEAQKSSAGMLFAKAALDMEIARVDVEEIQGETRKDNPANEKYKQLLGFEFEKDDNGKEKPIPDLETGVEYFKMSRKK